MYSCHCSEYIRRPAAASAPQICNGRNCIPTARDSKLIARQGLSPDRLVTRTRRVRPMANSVAGPLVVPVQPLADCPSDEQLLAFIPGELAPEIATSVTAHLEACTSCQSRLTTLRHR